MSDKRQPPKAWVEWLKRGIDEGVTDIEEAKEMLAERGYDGDGIELTERK
jgi:hypothetical protein